MIDVVRLLVIGAASATTVAYVCRLGALYGHDHRLSIILMHAGLCSAVFGVGIDAWLGLVTLQGMAVLTGAAAWIVASYGRWRDGVPAIWRKETTQ